MEHNKDNEENEALAQARALVYRMAQCVTAGYPTRQNMAIVFGEAACQAVGMFATEKQAASYEAHRADYHEGPQAWLDRQRDSYTRLFIGPGELAALPWESCYQGEGRLIFQQCALDVRAAYREQGFQPVCKNKVPDDHVSLELGFLAELAERGGEASRRASRDFLEKHLMRWLPAYRDALSEADGHGLGFYADAIDFTAGFCEADLERLEAGALETAA